MHKLRHHPAFADSYTLYRVALLAMCNGQLEEVAEYQGWEANSDATKPPEMKAEERVPYSIKRNADSVLSRSPKAVII